MASSSRLRVLDGWRAVSILAVLAGHLAPLGPPRAALNETAARFGMAVFFSLSGFLITTALLTNPSVRAFLVRRAFRIVPLAWLFATVALVGARAPAADYPAHWLFYANLPPFWLTPLTGHLWSLCVEMQFYVGVALLVAASGARGLLALPALALLVTLGRIASGAEASIVTYLRVDEILAGATVALAFAGKLGRLPESALRSASSPLLLVATVAASSPWTGPLAYLRPYLAASLVGSSLFQPERRISRWLEGRWLAYIAEISYALYVVHPLAMHGWFAPPNKVVLYTRRPLGVALSFALAHLSTRYYERPWLALGKELARLAQGRPRVEPAPAPIAVRESRRSAQG